MECFVYGAQREVPDEFSEFLDPRATAVVSIDMTDLHLADTPDCPCPGPRAREIVEPIDVFNRAARRLGVPIIHVRYGADAAVSTMSRASRRRGG